MTDTLRTAARYFVIATMIIAPGGSTAMSATFDTDAGTSSIGGLADGGLDADGNRIFTFAGNLSLTDGANTVTGSRGMRIQATGNILLDGPLDMSGANGSVTKGDGGAGAGIAPLPEFGGGQGGAGMTGNGSPNPSIIGANVHGEGPQSGAAPLGGGQSGSINNGDANTRALTGGNNPLCNGDCGSGGAGGANGGAGGNGGIRGGQGFGGQVFGDPDVEGLGTLSGGGGGGGAGSGWAGNSGANGGGALALEAGGDLTIGASASVNLSGGVGGEVPDGDPNSGGGGGAGGTLVLSGNNVNVDGLASLLADGGEGGKGEHGFGAPNPDFAGGGGGGGRIALYANDGDVVIDNIVALAAGDAPLTFLGDSDPYAQLSTAGGPFSSYSGQNTGNGSPQSGGGGSVYLQAIGGASLPEPSTLILGLVGAVWITCTGRRRRRNRQ